MIKKSFDYFSFLFGTFVCLIFALAKIYDFVILSYFGIFCLLFSIIFIRTEKILLLFFFLIPNTGYLSLYGNGLVGYFAILIVLKLAIIDKLNINFKKLFFLISTCVIVILSSILNGFYGNILSFIKVIFYFVLMYTVKDQFCKNKVAILNNYIVGTTIGAILGFFYSVQNGYKIFDINRYSRFSSLSGDPNYYSAIIVFALSLLMFLVLSNEKKVIPSLPVFAVLLLAGLSSLSRAFLVSLIVVAFIAFTYLLFSTKIKIFTKIGILVSVFAVLLFLSKYTNAFDMILSRFYEESMETGNGRLDIWNWYISKTFSSIDSSLIGCGSAHIAVSSGLINYIEHNTYIQILYEIGIIGVVMFFLSVYSFYVDTKKNTLNNKINYLSFIPLSAVLIPYFFVSQMYGENFIIAILLCLLICTEKWEKTYYAPNCRDKIRGICVKPLIEE